MAPTFVAEIEVSSWSTGDSKNVAVSAQAGDVLVCLGATADAATTLGTPTNNGTGLTWTLRQSYTTSSYAAVYAWTATVDTTRSITVTVTRGGTSDTWGFGVLQWRNATVGASAKNIGASGTPSVSITTGAAESAICWVSADCDGTSGTATWPTVGVSATPDTDQQPGGSGATRFFVGHWTDTGTTGVKAPGLSAPSGQKWTAIAVEIQTAATPISVSDTVTLGVTDTATKAVIASVAVADTVTLSASDTATVVAARSVSDTITLGVTDTRAILSTSSRTDTVTLGVTDTSTVGIAASLPGADAVSLAVSDVATIRRAASRSLLSRPWDSRDGWQTLTRGPAWEAELARHTRTLSGWGELVDGQGRPMQIMTETGRPRWRLPLSGANITHRGDQTESWSAQLSFSHPWMLPISPKHPLWGASGLRVRLWWSIWSRTAGAWWSRPVCTLAVGDTDADDDGIVSGTVTGRDVLSTMVGYGRGAPTVVGMTIDKAIGIILARSAPSLRARIAPTIVTVPDGTVLRDPKRDLEDLAAAGYLLGVARSDIEGVAYVGPRPVSTDPPLDWQEGPGNPASHIRWRHGVTAMGNQVTAVSTHPDAVGLSVTVADDDPTSPTWVGGPWGVHPLQTVESSVAATTTALTSVALAALDRGLHPTADVEVTIPQRPDLYGWRPARVSRSRLGMADLCQVASWPLALPVPGVTPAPMRVSMIQRVD